MYNNSIQPEVIDVQPINPFTASTPSERVSSKYKFISTAQFIQDVQSMGYSLIKTNGPRKGMGMHSMEFSHPNMPKLDGIELRLLATNSHDATSAFRLYITMLVQVCSNGLVAWHKDAGTASRVLHRGYANDKVAHALNAVHSKIDGLLGQVQQFYRLA